MIEPDPDNVRFPVLDRAVLDQLAEFGTEREVASGEVLFRAGAEVWGLMVVLSGEIQIVTDDDFQDVIVNYTAGQFIGELGLLTGQRTYLTARVVQAGRVLAVPNDAFRRLMATKPAISDVIFAALIARREALRSSPAANAVRIIGSRYSPEALALRTFASRNRLAHSWIDLEEADDVEVLLASMGLRPVDTPVVVTPTTVLRHPTPGEFATLIGLTYHPIPGRTFDLVVVGVGPAGLAAVGLRRFRGPRHGVPRRRRARGAGRFELADRELRRLPQRDLRW